MGVYIIAEAGVNHNGNIDLAYQLIDKAVQAGVDCIKFQTFSTEKLVTNEAKTADYQRANTGTEESQISLLKKLELSHEQFRQLAEYCKKSKIQFLSTPFDIDSIDFLNELDIPFWKIPSGEITNLPYLVAIAKTGKDVVMSTGMCDIEEIKSAIKVLKDNGTTNIKLLHCNTEYPTPFEDVNLRAMQTMKEVFDVEVGYSDHTKGIEVPIAAVALGASVIEKHFTLDCNMEGPDHKASLEPDELKEMVISIRNIEKALGKGEKVPSESEEKNKAIVRKSIVALRPIKKGELFSEENITTKRPGTGVSPMKWFDVLGTTAVRDFRKDELIEI